MSNYIQETIPWLVSYSQIQSTSLCEKYPANGHNIAMGLDLGEPTHTLAPCWMPKPLPPRNECTCCFAPATGPLVNLS